MSQRSRWVGVALLVGLGAVAPGLAAGAELDGSVPMLCAVMAVTECHRGGVCEPADAGAAGLPPFVRVNVGQKALEATDGSGRRTAIHSAAVVKEKERLLLQGGENGRGWSVVIGQKTGEMTAAIVDHDGGFLLSGVCTVP